MPNPTHVYTKAYLLLGLNGLEKVQPYKAIEESKLFCKYINDILEQEGTQPELLATTYTFF